jgi:4-amino-4-deoxy-L-arabinose transferase-like glycosyltransferase
MSPVHESTISYSRRSYGVALAVLFAVFALAWFGHLEHRGLFIPDEGRYAEIPREMLASGDWITPRLNGLKYFEKPPLQYWLTALSFQAFGPDEWTARLAPAVLGFLALAFTGYAASVLWGRRAGLLTAASLASNWIFYLGGQYLTLDMSVSAFLSFSLSSFLLAQREQAPPRERTGWMLAAWSGMALAVLSKGLIGIVLPGLSMLAYTIWTRDLRIWSRLSIRYGLPLFLVIVLPWFILVQQHNPEFLHFFFIREHLERFALSAHQRPGAWWYYLPILVIGLMPWTPALLHEAVTARWWKNSAAAARTVAGFRTDRFCIAWAMSVIVFFSISHSKLPAYVLPAIPAIAMLLGARLRELPVPPFRAAAWGVAILGTLLFAGTSRLHHWTKFAALGPEGASGLPWLYCATGVLLVSGLLAVRLCDRRQAGAAVAALALGTFAFWSASFAFMHHVDSWFSSERLIEQLTDERKPFHPDLPFYSVGQFDHSVPFYLGRTLTLVDVRGELGPGIDAEPDKVITSIEEFCASWRGRHEQAYAVMTPALHAEFQRAGLPMFEVVHDPRLVIVSRNR